jgi:hypothetical protein
MAKTKKRAPGLYQKAKQHEAEKLAGGRPRSTRLAAQAKRAANDNEVDALSDDAISTTDPRKTVINYGDDNIECDVSNNKGDNDEEAEEDGDNDQSCDENEQSGEDDSDDEDGDGDEDDIDDDDYVGKLYDDDESDDDSLMGGKYRVPSARGKGAGRKPDYMHVPEDVFIIS